MFPPHFIFGKVLPGAKHQTGYNAALRGVSGHVAGTFVFVDGSGRIRGWQWR